MVTHEVEDTRGQLRHVTFHATQLFVVSMRLGIRDEAGMTLATLHVSRFLPFQGSGPAAMHLMTAQTTHPTLKASALGLSRAMIVETGQAAVSEEAQPIMVSGDRDVSEWNSWIIVNRIAPIVLLMAAAATVKDSSGIEILGGMEETRRRRVTGTVAKFRPMPFDMNGTWTATGLTGDCAFYKSRGVRLAAGVVTDIKVSSVALPATIIEDLFARVVIVREAVGITVDF
jgi:hypothetical protein